MIQTRGAQKARSPRWPNWLAIREACPDIPEPLLKVIWEMCYSDDDMLRSSDKKLYFRESPGFQAFQKAVPHETQNYGFTVIKRGGGTLCIWLPDPQMSVFGVQTWT